MERTLLFCVMFALFLAITAEQVVGSPQKNRAKDSQPAAPLSSNINKSIMEGELLRLAGYVKHVDTRLQERLKDSYDDLNKQLKQREAHLKERLEEGDSRLNAELNKDVTWLTEKLTKGQRRVDQELVEQGEAIERLRDSARTQQSCALFDDLKQQVSDFQEELNRTKHLLLTTQQTVQSLSIEVNRLQSSHRLGLSNSSEMEEGRNVSASDPCDDGYSLLCGRCLKILEEKMTYQQGQQRCQQMGQGRPIMSKTKENLYCVYTVLKANGISDQRIWVGIDDLQKEGHWVWKDNTTLDTNSELWAEGEPSNGNRGPGEHCAEIIPWLQVLNDVYCHVPHYVICEKDP